VYLLSLSSSAGRVEHQELVVVPSRDHVPAAEHRRRGAAVLAALEPQIHRIQRAHARVQAACEGRARLLADVVVPASRALVQAGLFDRRAIHSSVQRARAAGELGDMLARAARSASDPTALAPALELIGILDA
jgi:hypothetical protein